MIQWLQFMENIVFRYIVNYQLLGILEHCGLLISFTFPNGLTFNRPGEIFMFSEFIAMTMATKTANIL